MNTLQSFLELAQELQKQGFTIPHFRYRDPQITAPTHYYSSVVEEGIDDLGLLVSLSFSLQPRRKRVALSDFKRKLPVDYVHRIQLDYQSLYVDPAGGNWEDFDVPAGKFRNLPRQLKKEVTTLTDLSDYLEDYDSEMPRQKQYSSEERKQPSPIHHKTWEKLFGMLVRERKLQWISVEDQNIPYVKTTSDMISQVYENRGGLIFVAADLAKEDWQEQIAVHFAYWIAESGSDRARVEAQELAFGLGKGLKYVQWHWRLKVNNQLGNG